MLCVADRPEMNRRVRRMLSAGDGSAVRRVNRDSGTNAVNPSDRHTRRTSDVSRISKREGANPVGEGGANLLVGIIFPETA